MMVLLAKLDNLIPKHDHAQAAVAKKQIAICRSKVAANVSLGGDMIDTVRVISERKKAYAYPLQIMTRKLAYKED
jgi:hypothetical protein